MVVMPILVVSLLVLACGGGDAEPTSTPRPSPRPSPTSSIPPTFPAEFSAMPTGWINQFGSSSVDRGEGIAMDSQGNAYVVGTVGGNLPGQSSQGSRDAFLRKYGPEGAVLTTLQFGTSESDTAAAVILDSDGNVYLAGITSGAFGSQGHFGGEDGFIRKLSPDLTEMWTVQFGSSENDEVASVAVDGEGNVYVAGGTEGALPGVSSTGGMDAFVRKHGPDGQEVWTAQFGSSAEDEAAGVAVDSEGNVYVAGRTEGTLPDQGSRGRADIFLRKYDSSGREVWTVQFGTVEDDWATEVVLDPDGNVYVVGVTGGALPGQESSGDDDAFIRKYDPEGQADWTAQLGSNRVDEIVGVALVESQGIYVAGWTMGVVEGTSSAIGGDAFVSRYDLSGQEQWIIQFVTPEFDWATGIAVNAAGEILVVGRTNSTLPGQSRAGSTDAFVIQVLEE